MSVLVSVASGNFTTNTTWGLVDTTSYLNAENATESLLTTAYSGTRSSAFTPGAITVSHLGVKLAERIGTTGTMSVSLRNATIGLDDFVAGTEVTIDVADLPSALEADLNGGWQFFKLATPVLLLAANDYNIQAKTSSATQVDLFCDGTADNLSRILVVTTNQSPVAGDDMIIAEEKTGQGTANAFTVTMDDQSTTDYGAASTSLVTPALAICDGGTLTYATTAATNFYLRLSGHLIVYSGGTLNIGTTGTPIPRDSTAVLEFDPAADGDMGLTVRNLGTWNSQGLSRTSGKNIVSCKLNTDEAASQTTLGVDTDTGWLNTDEIAIASTTRTNSQTESRVLSGNAGASSIDVTVGLTNAHSGTSPTQAEVILLTRNVIIRSATSSIMAFVNVKPTSTVDIDWTLFRYLGEAAAGKRGIEIETTTGSFNMTYSAGWSFEDGGIYVTGSASNNISITYFVGYLLTTASNSATTGAQIATATSGSSIVFDNWIILNTALPLASSGGIGAIHLLDVGITFTNITIAGTDAGSAVNNPSTPALTLGEENAQIGTFDGITIHSNEGSGICILSSGSSGVSPNGTISNLSVWRNNLEGMIVSTRWTGTTAINAIMDAVIFDTGTFFGNTTSNIKLSSDNNANVNGSNIFFKDFSFSGDSTFSTTNGVLLGADELADIHFNSCTFGVASGIRTAHTNDLNLNSALTNTKIKLNNCSLASATELANFSNALKYFFVKSTKHDQTAGSHKSWFKYGIITSDTSISNTASPSERLTPNNASNKLESGSKKVAVASGNTVTVSVYMRESVVGDGTDYNGNRPRLILKRNDAAGITADTVIDTGTVAAEGAFEQLTGTTASVTDDAVLEFVVDCDGTTGWVNVDDWTTT